MKKQRNNTWFFNIAAVILGNFICAVGIKLFLEPAGIAASSTTGLAMTVEHYFNIHMSYVVFVINMLMFNSWQKVCSKHASKFILISGLP